MLSDRTTCAPAKHHAARDAADVAQSTSQQSCTCCGLRAGRPRSLCAQLRCMLPALRITCVCYRVHANINSGVPSLRVSRTGHPRAAMAARCTDGGSLSCARGAFASLLYTSPLYTNCSNCSFTSVGGSRTGPPWASMTAQRAAQQAAFCFFVRPRWRVVVMRCGCLMRAAGRADEGGAGGGDDGGGGASAFPGSFIARLLKARTSYLYFAPAAPPGVAG